MAIQTKTREMIFDHLRLEGIKWCGDFDEVEFLGKIWELDSMPSTDPRHTNAAEDIWRHRIVNPTDWDDDWIFTDSRFDLSNCDDSLFLEFLCVLVHPLARPDPEEAENIVELLNDILKVDRFVLKPTRRVGKRFYYSACQVFSSDTVDVGKITDEVTGDANDFFTIQITRMESAVDSDPDLAIGTAKEFIESVCKTILEDHSTDYGKTEKVTGLARKTLKQLKLTNSDIPEQIKSAEVIKELLMNLATIVKSINELRNDYGTGHGRSASAKGLSSRHASLVVNAAKTFGLFLMSTHREQVAKQAKW
tara:strand:+ start:66245 stop:67165 length:921 start_codon:yes stop_codon:yes gene_type:complete